jgi:ABC1 atypical kinase-like domain
MTTTTTSFPLSIRGGATAPGIFHVAPRLILVLVVGLAVVFLALLAFHRGFRRSVQFWTRVAPLVVEYKALEFRSSHPFLMSSSSSMGATNSNSNASSWLRDYHIRTAPKVVQIILDLGGIYVKIGQVMSTIGQAIMPDEYVQALIPLQNGVKPRSYDEIRRIIERSAGGRTMSSLFVEFDREPIGSASIAQVHRARLAPTVVTGGTSLDDDDGQVVVVKVQYPEVAEQFGADLANLELVTRILAPDQLPMIRALRQRHENELDFRLEASHLTECRHNLLKHWNSQSNRQNNMLVTIPRVLNETGLCTKHVLVMEYLDGTPLAQVLEEEQVRLAKALRWMPTSSSSSSPNEIDPKEARRQLTSRLRKHYLASSKASGGDDGFALTTTTQSEGDDFPMLRMMKRHARFVQALAPAGLKMLHLYANVRDRVEQVGSTLRRIVRRDPHGHIDGNPHPLSRGRKLNLARALKTLIRVHGLQLLRDGVYNADPHPVRRHQDSNVEYDAIECSSSHRLRLTQRWRISCRAMSTLRLRRAMCSFCPTDDWGCWITGWWDASATTSARWWQRWWSRSSATSGARLPICTCTTGSGPPSAATRSWIRTCCTGSRPSTSTGSTCRAS